MAKNEKNKNILRRFYFRLVNTDKIKIGHTIIEIYRNVW